MQTEKWRVNIKHKSTVYSPLSNQIILMESKIRTKKSCAMGNKMRYILFLHRDKFLHNVLPKLVNGNEMRHSFCINFCDNSANILA